VKGAWAERGASAEAGRGIRAALDGLATWLGADTVRVGSRVPRIWAGALRA
jgi:uncharacterized protein YcaQ